MTLAIMGLILVRNILTLPFWGLNINESVYEKNTLL